MIRELVRELQPDDINYYEWAGLSTDEPKPMKGCTGSVFFEVDTGKAYFFDEVSGEWIEAGSASSGSTGGES